MDQTVVGVDNPALIAVGDEVSILGGEGPSLDEVASVTSTIAYEIATGLTRRLPRHYHRAGTPIIP
jgi:alanine racemase